MLQTPPRHDQVMVMGEKKKCGGIWKKKGKSIGTKETRFEGSA